MPDYLITILLATIPAAISLAVTWGVLRTEVNGMKEHLGRHDKELEQSVKKESCQQSHRYTDQTIDSIKSDIRDIKRMLEVLLKQSGES